jgi:hypothetical protein
VTAAAICGVNLNQDGVIIELSHSTLTYVLPRTTYLQYRYKQTESLRKIIFKLLYKQKPQKWKVRTGTCIKKPWKFVLPAPIREDVWGVDVQFQHSSPRHWMEVTAQTQTLAVSPPGELAIVNACT